MPPPPSSTPKAAAAKRPESCQSAGPAGTPRLSPPPDVLRRKPSAGILTTSTTASGTRTAHITTTATACPAAAAATATTTAPHASRHPLRRRDQNAATALHAVKPGHPTPKPPPSPAARMPPHERSSGAGHRQPTVARTVNKPPVTPKVAARPPAPPHQAPTLATPLQRRSAAESTLSVHGGGARDRDELMSPVSAFLSSNITPRSSSRQSRVDSANSTPTGTPGPDRQDPWETRSGVGPPGTDDAPRRPVVTFSPPSEVGTGSRQDRDSKFFYASEAQKPTPQPAATRPALQQQRPSSFFYANGNTLPERQNAPSRPFSPPLASPSSQESLMSKFIYANGTPELQPPAKIGPMPQKKPGSVVSTASRVPTARQGNVPRATSPVKPSFITPKTSTSAAVSPRSPVSAASSQATNPSSQGKANTEHPARPKSHARTKSATAIEPAASTRRLSAQNSLPPSGSTSPSNPPRHGPTLPNNPATAGFASLLQAAEDFTEAEEAQPESPDSPTKTSQDGQATELVANARRERKVQDLEITNASLEAINRTLERQLRKQTAELRRYQRLSRSGRLSLGSIGSRIPSLSTVDGEDLASAAMELNDLSEEESEIDEEDAELGELDELGEGDDMSGSEASGDGNPETAELRQKKRRGDERRLQLDLSRHQQLLVDSQKINQSIKRCLGWTEELIKEGQRALSYQVRVSDVSLGGRVLAPEEVERRERGDDDTEDLGLEADTIYAIDALGGGTLAAPDASVPAATWGKDAQDRDSGIELPADGG